MLNLIVNPIAGGKNGEKMKNNLSLIESRLKEKNAKYRIYFSEYKGHAKKLTEELIDSGVDNIIAVGGDGTLHEVINGFKDFDKVALGIIPCGTGNDFASSLKIPENINGAVDLILDGKPSYTDFLQLPSVRCINIVGIGIDVDVLKKYEALKKKNKWGYTKCLIKTLMKFDYTDFTAEYNGKKEKFRSFIACVANGVTYGGGIPICPVAETNDNKLDFVAIREMKKLKIIGAFIKLKKGKVLSLKQAHHEKATMIKITTKTPYTVNVDGELYDNIEFKVKVVPNMLRVYR